ncbi:PQQ-binding-like beta-propeller repeat protein [Bradyrhizobium sp. ISRA443]|uniref:outer membrane protein assembly factor BamB family protein n=2 Tax=Bradyrhizobium TaxID=374 RepID=UPI00247AB062|nr:MULTISPECIES: PQQ-binding-like beta-propeller repeat protein [unclassified Bradyrhizobium]WGS06910.1 PQQ-binding-like beta-propeller repeat protein [Bradyrhizobium sp. ISRA437]WGS13792.1 PQQ-binding-like beta-propeller repeat protein [Bradyrhizobium sp. ISRA443]
MVAHPNSLRAPSISVALMAAVLSLAPPPPSARAQDSSVLTYHADNSRSGHYVVPALSWEKAKSVQIDETFKASIAGSTYAQPLYWRPSGANTGMLFVATEDNVVYALDATTGKELWRRAVGRPVRASSLPCGNINPLGITGTPVIDPATQAIYFDAAVERASGPSHEVFALSTKDGSVLPGWPVDVAGALQRSGRHFDPRVQNQRAALTLLDDTLYVAFGGHFGDCGNYHGWIVGISLRDPGKLTSFATRARGGGSWSPGGLSVIGHDIYFTTGNTMGAQTWSDGEAVFHVGADLRRSDDKRNYFAPSDWKTLDAGDVDLGGSNPLPLDVPGAGGDRALILALGKDGKAYLLDRHDLGGIGGQLAVKEVSQSSIITSPASYRAGNDVFVAFRASGAQCPSNRGHELTVLKITADARPAVATAWCGALRGRGSPIVTTTDGHSNPIVWILGAEGDDRLHAFRGDTGEQIYASETLRGLRRFQTPIATKDRLYVAADERVYAFKF